MNWTGGSLKRVPKNNSLTSRERLIQKQFIGRKEMQRKCASNQQIIDSINNQSSDERHDSSQEFKSNSSKESINSQKINTKVEPLVKNESEKRYFDEILDQLFWRHSDFKKDKTDQNSTHNQIN
jgi:hypothetical protein